MSNPFFVYPTNFSGQVILLTAIMVGMSTVEEFEELDWYRSLTHFWDWFAIMAFTLELVIRIIVSMRNKNN